MLHKMQPPESPQLLARLAAMAHHELVLFTFPNYTLQ